VRVRFSTLLTVAFASLCIAGGAKPNIVFILTDDQGYGDLGCYGSKDIATPAIDKLCEEGMRRVANNLSPCRTPSRVQRAL
jgi:arylsulfatase A-like enzyme